MAALASGFVVFGVFWGAWAVIALDVQRFLDLSDAGLGWLVAATITGAAAANAIGGRLADRYGGSKALVVTLAAWSLLVAATAAATNEALFIALYILAVGTGGLYDVLLNVVAAAHTSGDATKLLRLHATFNAGTVAGAAAAGAVLATDWSWRIPWFGVGAVALALVPLLLAAAPKWAGPTPAEDAREPQLLRAAAMPRWLLPLALMFGGGAMVEGGVSTWGVLYLRDELGMAAAGGAGAFVIGAVLATGTRGSLGPLARRLTSARATRLGLGLAAAGLVLEASSTNGILAGAGLALASVGSCVYWPLLVAVGNAAAAAHGAPPGRTIGTLTAAGYIGFLAGPPAVGLVADAYGIDNGILLLAAVSLLAACVRIWRPTGEGTCPTTSGASAQQSWRD